MNLRIIYLSTLILLAGCSNPKKNIVVDETDIFNTETALTKKDVVEPDTLNDLLLNNTGLSTGEISDSSYHEKTIKPANYSLNDKLKVLYFEDSIQHITCALYLKSELDIVDSTYRPANYKILLENLESNKVILVINNNIVRLNVKIRDAEIMLPTSLAYFSLYGKNYLLIKMNLVSAMAGDYWFNLLLEVDSQGNVNNQQGIETTGEITFQELRSRIS